jgi:hypothetical protein
MSIQSYRKNRSLGVTGPRSDNCFPAALEQVSPNHSYDPSIYTDYSDWVHWYYSFPLKERDGLFREYEEIVDHLVRPLGGLACEDLRTSRAETTRGFLRVVRPLLEDDWRVTVLTGGLSTVCHAVGLLPVGGETDQVVLVSTNIPQYFQGIIDIRQVADHLSVYEEKRIPGHPLNAANIIALPPD